jgi:hypothetical protein
MLQIMRLYDLDLLRGNLDAALQAVANPQAAAHQELDELSEQMIAERHIARVRQANGILLDHFVDTLPHAQRVVPDNSLRQPDIAFFTDDQFTARSLLRDVAWPHTKTDSTNPPVPHYILGQRQNPDHEKQTELLLYPAHIEGIKKLRKEHAVDHDTPTIMSVSTKALDKIQEGHAERSLRIFSEAEIAETMNQDGAFAFDGYHSQAMRIDDGYPRFHNKRLVASSWTGMELGIGPTDEQLDAFGVQEHIVEIATDFDILEETKALVEQYQQSAPLSDEY